MPEVMLTIQNVSSKILRLGFIRGGVTLNPSETTKVNNLVVDNDTFRSLENSGDIKIIDYGDDYTRFTLREEISGTGGGELFTTKKIFPKETVLKGQWFIYVLTPRPTSSIETQVSVNGVDQVEGKDFSIDVINGKIHWLVTADFDIDMLDEVVVRYTHE